MSSTGTSFEDAVLLSAIKDDLRKQFDRSLTNIQIQEMLRGLGFKVVSQNNCIEV